MKAQRWIERMIAIAIVLMIVIAGFGQAVLQLWNLLMPEIFGLPEITFWQAVGLLALSWILFGGLRGLGFSGRVDWSWADRWERMTPEERRRFREGLRAMESRMDR
jgi:hypothetical protein